MRISDAGCHEIVLLRRIGAWVWVGEHIHTALLREVVLASSLSALDALGSLWLVAKVMQLGKVLATCCVIFIYGKHKGQ